MNLYELFSEGELAAQIEARMIKATPHPTASLRILNYTQIAQFTPQLWTHVTDKCRGLIVNDYDEIVARPFEKFWNLNDARHPETLYANLPTASPVLTRKMDGSLGIGYQVNGEWGVATRGSFASEQAVWASKWLRSHSATEWPKGYTPLFEIIFPENQIVVRYDYEGLVLLSLVNITTGEEMSRAETATCASVNGLRLVEEFDRPLEDCAREDEPNEEGYVAAWSRLGATPLRVKIKYATYCRLHKLLTQTNAVTIWEMLRDGLSINELTSDVPAEFREWIDGLEKRFRAEYTTIRDGATEALNAYEGEKNIANAADKKAFALYALTKGQLTPILFAMADGKRYEPIIWKMIRPRGDEKTFKIDES